MGFISSSAKCFIVTVILAIAAAGILVSADNPYRHFTWTVHYGTIYPLGLPQQGIFINGQFPGPQLEAMTNDNIVINVINKLDKPFLLSWNGIQHRKNSYEDGVLGTTCPIPKGRNYTYQFQLKDQIGSFFYFPSTLMHKAAGGFGAIKIVSRPLIPIPFPTPAGDFSLLIGDWYKGNHAAIRRWLDKGKPLGMPNGVHINGQGRGYSLRLEPGKTYRLRISNVGLSTTLNFRIQGHKIKLIEVEGAHTIQNEYESLDIHVGQSLSVLVTTKHIPRDYYIVASTRFTKKVLNAVGYLRYANSWQKALGPLPLAPSHHISWSMNQAKSIRWHLTASAARPNPQGSYHYGKIQTTRTIILANSAPIINGKQRYAVNGVSYVHPGTPLKLADFFKIGGVFNVGTISDYPGQGAWLATSVMSGEYRSFIEIVFQNNEHHMQSWHIDGYSYFVVGMDRGQWSPESRKDYNLFDAIHRCTTQVYPNSWTAILIALDNAGIWNIRSEMWARQYLGQQLYMRIYGGESMRDEYPVPKNALMCGKARGRHTRPFRPRA